MKRHNKSILRTFQLAFICTLILVLMVGCDQNQTTGKQPDKDSYSGKSDTAAMQPRNPGGITTTWGKASPIGESPPGIGMEAAEISFTDSDGTSYRLSDLKGKAVLIDFWATWCTPCLKSMPDLAKLDKAYRDRGLVVIGIAVSSQENQIAGILKTSGVEYGIYIDENDATSQAWEVPAFPSFVIIGKDGKIANAVVGMHTYGDMKQIVEDALAGKTPSPQAPPS